MTIESLDQVLDSIHQFYFEGKIDRVCYLSLKGVIDLEKRIMEVSADESAS